MLAFGAKNVGVSHRREEVIAVAFPGIHTFPETDPGTYERQMGWCIAGLHRVFIGRVIDIFGNDTMTLVPVHVG